MAFVPHRFIHFVISHYWFAATLGIISSVHRADRLIKLAFVLLSCAVLRCVSIECDKPYLMSWSGWASVLYSAGISGLCYQVRYCALDPLMHPSVFYVLLSAVSDDSIAEVFVNVSLCLS